jgi:hypothetical protein
VPSIAIPSSKIGFALGVVADEDVEPRERFEIELAIVAKVRKS